MKICKEIIIYVELQESFLKTKYRNKLLIGELKHLSNQKKRN